MPSTKDIVIGKKIMLLLIGKNGNGKTCQIASFAESGKGKIFDFDGRMDAIKSVFPDLDIEYDTYGVSEVEQDGKIRVKSFNSFTKEFFDLTKNCPYSWIAIDSITSLTTTVVNFQMMMKSGSGEDVKKTKGGIQVPSWDEFNGEAMVVSRLLDVAKILPCHVIFTAHPVIKSDIEKGGGAKIESIVSFGVKAPNIIPGYFNEIFYLDIEPSVNANKAPERVLYTRAIPGVPAKTTLPLQGKITLEDKGLGLYQVIQKALSK